MVNLRVGDDACGLGEVIPAGVQVAVEAREVGSGDFKPDAVAGGEEVARDHRGEGHLVDLVFLHPDLLVVAFAVAEPLDGFVEVVGGAVGLDVDQLGGDVGVLDVEET